jgi:hypothetical protein
MQTTVNLIGALLNHLLAALTPTIPDEVLTLYEQKCKRERKSVELPDLMNMFLSVCKIFKTVYICIDALDECSDARHLLRYIKDMPPSVRVFTTGRMHTTKAVNHHFTDISTILIEANEDDIRAFAKSKISESQLREPDIMDEKLDAEICSEIIRVSLGMSVLWHYT